jgi:hypothetical protein
MLPYGRRIYRAHSMTNNVLPKLSILLICFTITSCGGSSTATAPQPPPPVTAEVRTVTMPSFPHEVDIYSVANATRAVVFLHGGRGRNFKLAFDLGINLANAPPTAATANAEWLTDNNIVALFPLIGDETTEELVPNSDQSLGARRWVEDRREIIFTASAEDGVQQTFLYNTDSRILEQLNFDSGEKLGAFMWKAPEYDDDYLFFTMVDRTILRIYRKLDADGDGNLEWTAINDIQMPMILPYIWSPEPFVHNGKSYVLMQVGSSPAANDMSIPTQLALTGIDPEIPSFRMLTNDSSTRRVRMDPEVFITSEGPQIYYNRYLLRTDTQRARPDGIWRVSARVG